MEQKIEVDRMCAYDAIAKRAVAMLKRVKIAPDVVFTGGVAKNKGVVRAVSENLGFQVLARGCKRARLNRTM